MDPGPLGEHSASRATSPAYGLQVVLTASVAHRCPLWLSLASRWHLAGPRWVCSSAGWRVWGGLGKLKSSSPCDTPAPSPVFIVGLSLQRVDEHRPTDNQARHQHQILLPPHWPHIETRFRWPKQSHLDVESVAAERAGEFGSPAESTTPLCPEKLLSLFQGSPSQHCPVGTIYLDSTVSRSPETDVHNVPNPL